MPQKISGKTKIISIIGLFVVLAVFSVLFYLSYQKLNKEAEVRQPAKQQQTVREIDHGEIVATDYGSDWTDVAYEDGAHKRTITIGDTNYKAEDGSYQPVKTDIEEVQDEKSAYNYQNTSNFFASYFKKDLSADEFIKVEKDGMSVASSFIDANKDSKAIIKGNVLTYPDIYPNLDARYTISNGQILEEFILKENTELPNIVLKMKMAGVKLEKKDDGTIELKNEKTKELIWTIPAPLMYEENNKENVNYDLHYEIEPRGGEYYLSKVISEAGKTWLKSAKYPVVIDQTLLYEFNAEGLAAGNKAIKYIGYFLGWNNFLPANTFDCVSPGLCNGFCDSTCDWGHFIENPGSPDERDWMCEEFQKDTVSGEYSNIETDDDTPTKKFEKTDLCGIRYMYMWYYSQTSNQINFKFKIGIAADWITQMKFNYSGYERIWWRTEAKSEIYNLVNDIYYALHDSQGHSNIAFGDEGQDDLYWAYLFDADFTKYIDSNGYAYMRSWRYQGGSRFHICGSKYTDYAALEILYQVPTPTNIYFDNKKSTSVRMNWTDNIGPVPEEDHYEINRQRCNLPDPPPDGNCSGGAWVDNVYDNAVPHHDNQGPASYTGALATGLSESTLYRYRIRTCIDDDVPANGCSADEYSAWSAFYNVKTEPIPAPTNVFADDITKESVRLNWIDNNDTSIGNNEDCGFDIKRERKSGANWIDEGISGTTPPNIGGGLIHCDGGGTGICPANYAQLFGNPANPLSPNTLYRYQIRARVDTVSPFNCLAGVSNTTWTISDNVDPYIDRGGGRYTLAKPVTGQPQLSHSSYSNAIVIDNMRVDENNPNPNPGDTRYGVMAEYSRYGVNYKQYITLSNLGDVCNIDTGSSPWKFYYMIGNGEDITFKIRTNWYGFNTPFIPWIMYKDTCGTALYSGTQHEISIFSRNGDNCDNPSSDIDDDAVCGSDRISPDIISDANWKGSIYTRIENPPAPTFPVWDTDPLLGNLTNVSIQILVQDHPDNPTDTDYAVYDLFFNSDTGSFVSNIGSGCHDADLNDGSHRCCSEHLDCCNTPYTESCRSWGVYQTWGAGDPWIVGAFVYNYNDIKLTPNKGYAFKTYARNGDGTIGEAGCDLNDIGPGDQAQNCNSGPSAMAYTLANPPNAVTVGCYAEGGYKCDVGWSPSGANDNPDQVTYNVYRVFDAIPPAIPPCTSSYAYQNNFGGRWRGDLDSDPECADGVCCRVWGGSPILSITSGAGGNYDTYCKEDPNPPYDIHCDFKDENLGSATYSQAIFYLVTAKNIGNIENEIGKYGSDNTSLNSVDLQHAGHNQSSPFNIKWQWPAVVDPLHVPDKYAGIYRFKSWLDGTAEPPANKYIPKTAGELVCASGGTCSYTQTQYYKDIGSGNWQLANLDANTKYDAYAVAIDTRERQGLSSQPDIVSSNIEPTTGVHFGTITTNTLEVAAANTQNTLKFTNIFTNSAVGASAIDIQRKTPFSESGWEKWCGESGQYCDVSGGEVPSSFYLDDLSSIEKPANRRCCYRTKATNQDSQAIGDQTDWSMNDADWANPYGTHPDSCKCTYANTPKPPYLTQIEGTESFNVVINPEDENPHGPPPLEDTEYALCMEAKDDSGNLIESHYININDGVTGIADGPDCGATSPSDTSPDYWGTRTDWGDDIGITVDVDAFGINKYNFKFKARNCNIPPDVTAFGPSATLFLIKNNIVGWVWSANIGWISLNCLNNYLDPASYGYSCDTANGWGTNTYFVQGRQINPISGYAWSGAGEVKGMAEWQVLGNINISNSPGNSGYSKVALDNLGYPHVVWIEDSNDIYFKKWDGKNWITLGSNPVVTGATKPSLAIDSNGNPHIAYAGGSGITYKYWNQSANGCQGAWSTAEPVGSISASANSPSIVLDKKNFPHVAWVDNDGDDEIYYNHKDETGWKTPENVSSNASQSISQSLALDYSNRPHIVWSDSGSGNSDIYYKYKDENGIWQIRGSLNISIEFTGNSAVPSLALDSSGNPQVAWFDQSDGDFDVYYKYWNPTTSAWEVRGNANVSQNSYSSALLRLALDLDSSNLPHIVWSESVDGNNEIFYIYYKGDSWQSVENISNNSSSSELPHFVLDSNDSPHIVWKDRAIDDETNREIFYKYQDPGNSVSGLGWISYNKKVCTDDPQKQCDVNCDCAAGQCIESAGTPIGFCTNDANKECSLDSDCGASPNFCQKGYGFCSSGPGAGNKKYGVCDGGTNSGKRCESDTYCIPDGKCIYYTCEKDLPDCPDLYNNSNSPDSLPDSTEYCKITSTANFNGRTNQVEGWMRVLNQKEAGGTNNWGWIKLGGQYGGLGVDESTVGLWKFNENTGPTAKDSTTYGNDGTLTGPPSWTTDGKFATALNFDGTDDYVKIPFNNGVNVNSFTVEAWIKPTDANDARGIVRYTDGSAPIKGFYLRFLSGKVKFAVGDGTAPGMEEIGNIAPVLNQWNYMSATYNSSTSPKMKLYVNGSDAGSSVSATVTFANPDSEKNIYIGYQPFNGPNNYFNGMIDDVRISSRALEAQEIAAEYISGPYILTGTEVNSQEFFGSPDVDPMKVKLYSAFGWGWQDKVNPGYGWLEFMPTGSLIGIPWLETLYSDIYGKTGIALAPPPRTIGRYTSSYLIQSGGTISGIPSYYPGVYTGEPTTEYSIPAGFQDYGHCSNDDSLCQSDIDCGVGNTCRPGYIAKFSLDDITSKVTTLTTIVGGNKNKFGNEVTEYALPDDINTNISSSSFNNLFVDPTNKPGEIRLNQKVNRFKNINIKGNLVIDEELTFLNGDASDPFGNGTMVVDGDLIIQKNINYVPSGTCTGTGSEPCDSDEDCPADEICDIPGTLKSKNLASVAWFVKGDIYIDSTVNNIVGAFIAMGTKPDSEGNISTSRIRKTYSIDNANNDAWVQDGTTWSGSDPNVDFGKKGTNIRQSFLRWHLNNIPKGAEIKNAYIRFNSIGNYSTSFIPQIGLLGDASLDFSANPYNRPMAAITNVRYGSVGDWNTGEYSNSVSIAALVQKYIDSDEYLDSEIIFGTSGAVTGLLASNQNRAIAKDSSYMYVVGDNSSFNWRIEKRQLSDGALCDGAPAHCSGQAFDVDGIIDDAAASNTAYSISIDNAYMYVVGDYDIDYRWRIEKRQLSDGALCDGAPAHCSGQLFGTLGVIDGTALATKYARDVAIDSSYIYVVGSDSGGDDWRIEKRSIITGALVSSYWVNGNTSNRANTIAIDGSYMYVAGTNSTGHWRIEKHQLSDLALCDGLGLPVHCSGQVFDGDGIIDYSDISVQSYDIAIDPVYMYLGGYDSNTDWRIEKRQLSDGALCDGLGTPAHCSGQVFGTSGVVISSPGNIPYSITLDSTYIYLGGYDSNTDWRIEKRKLSDGTLDSKFGTNGAITSSPGNIAYGIASDLTYMYVVGPNDAPDWRIEKRFLTNGILASGNYIGLRIFEGNAGNDIFRSFNSYESLTKPAQLVIDYSLSQKTYTVASQADDAWAWGTGAGDCVSTGDCRNNTDNKFGRFDIGGGNYQSTRSFVRFGPLEIAPKSDIEKAELILTAGNPAGADTGFTARVALLTNNEENILPFTSNPYSYSWDREGEVEFTPTVWTAGSIINNLPDISRLVEKYVDKNKYKPTYYLGFRLIKYPNEDSPPSGNAYRAFTNFTSDSVDNEAKLIVKYNSQLVINGIVIARKFNFDRKYLKGLESSEKIIYDGRVVTNTPPGLEDFTKALPDLQQVIP